MLLNSDDLEISDLASEADVSVRTVRFYQQEGLMPAPGTRGKTVHYGKADLSRLRLIKALQEERLTIAEIRDRIGPMDDHEVARELASLGTNRSSAADYARSIRLGLVQDSPPIAFARRAEASSHSGSTWERIVLGHGIELHVQRPLSHPENRLVAELIEHARNTLKNGESR